MKTGQELVLTHSVEETGEWLQLLPGDVSMAQSELKPRGMHGWEEIV